MRTLSVLLLVGIAVPSLTAQVPVKKDVMALFAKIPPPPASSKEAFAKGTITANGASMRCSHEKIFGDVEDAIKAIDTEFAQQGPGGTGAGVPGMSQENARKMNDPELKKKMKNMSKEERMKMAMEMSKSASVPGHQPDPPAVRAALDAWQPIYNSTQQEYEKAGKDQQEEMKLQEEYTKEHGAIDAWESGEIAKLPRISSGETDAPDPAAVKAVKLKADDKHIAASDKRLKVIRSRWQASFDHAVAMYTAFYEKLVAADYASGSPNFSSKKVLADAQLRILENIRYHVKASRDAWEASAAWQARKATLQNQ